MPSQEVLTTKVVVHPLVLLSVVDHFNRMGKIGNQKRVVGVLLGCWRAKGVLDVSNSFAGKLNFKSLLCQRNKSSQLVINPLFSVFQALFLCNRH